MGERPGEREGDFGPGERALATSALGNSTAFGFSVMITASFGMLSRELGAPGTLDLFVFGAGAAIAVALIEGLVTRGFRRRIEPAPAEVAMLGTALNLVSVTIAIAIAYGAGETLAGVAGWGCGAVLAAGAYVLVESSEVLIAEFVQGARGDPDAPDESGS